MHECNIARQKNNVLAVQKDINIIITMTPSLRAPCFRSHLSVPPPPPFWLQRGFHSFVLGAKCSVCVQCSVN